MASAECTDSVLTFCKKLPKVELHAHLNGSISDSTMRKLIRRYCQLHSQSSDVGIIEDWTTTIGKGSRRTLKECFAMFKIIHTIVCDEEAVCMVAHDVVCDFAADGVIYLELRSTPRHNHQTGMTKTKYIDAVLKGFNQAVAECNSSINVRLLLSIDRSKEIVDALETVKLAQQYNKSIPAIVVGIDLSGNPEVGNVQDLLPALKVAKESGLKLSVHLSEIPNVNKETALLLGTLPDRIGHGTFLTPNLGGTADNLELVRSKRTPIELCLTSNVKCQTVSTYEQHQFRFWFSQHRSHPLVICTDDKGVFSTTLSEEYCIAADTFNLSASDLWGLSQQAVNYVFDDTLKDELKNTFELLAPL